MLEALLRDHAPASLQKPAKAWLRQLKQVRRAAGPVRDLDVHRKLLEPWVAHESSPLQEQAAKLDGWLKGRRKHLGSRMQKQVGKRRQALQERQSAFWAAVDSAPPGAMRAPRSTDAVALEQFVHAADAMPLLDAENLHDFRKATKKARYVAESGSEEENSRVAKALKRVQDAIGEWHDWLCLSQEADAALGKDAPELASALEREVEQHFAAAMHTTKVMRGRLSGEWIASHGKRPATAVSMGERKLASGF